MKSCDIEDTAVTSIVGFEIKNRVGATLGFIVVVYIDGGMSTKALSESG